jgi:hypothetical protein
MPPPDPDDREDIEQARKEAKLLAKVRATKFDANPEAIRPFESATLTWEVFVPPDVASEIDVTVTLGGQAVPRAGTKSVSPLTTGAFSIEAQSSNAKRILKTEVVRVDDVTGRREDVLAIRDLQNVANVSKTLLIGTGNLELRGDLALSARPPDGLLIKAPLKVRIPNFFDAEIDIAVVMALSAVTRPGGARLVSARLTGLDVDIVFHIVEHILSLGSATAVQAIVQPMAAELIRSYVKSSLERDVAGALQEAVNIVLAGFRATDPRQREHRLFSIATRPGFIEVVGFPVPGLPPVIGGGIVTRGRLKRSRAAGRA